MAEIDYRTRLELLQRAIERGEAKDHDYKIVVESKEEGPIHFFYKDEEITTFFPKTMSATDNGQCAKFFQHFDPAYPANVERNIRALEDHYGKPIKRDFLSVDFGSGESIGKNAQWTGGVKTRKSGNRKQKDGSWSKGEYRIYSVSIPSEVVKDLKLTPNSRLSLKATVVRGGKKRKGK